VLRTFLALDLPEVLLDAAEAAAGGARSTGVCGRWVDRAVMHVTLRFFGATDDALVSQLSGLVASLGARPPPRVRCARIGAFPDLRRARVLVLPIEELEPVGTIVTLAAEAEAFAVAAGCAPEGRSFKPHLTLARFREPTDVRALPDAVPVSDVAAPLEGVTLYESKLGQGGPQYLALARAPFGG
jgi:RNA 2',3'-cyclic 3'-phosphodiesterase